MPADPLPRTFPQLRAPFVDRFYARSPAEHTATIICYHRCRNPNATRAHKDEHRHFDITGPGTVTRGLHLRECPLWFTPQPMRSQLVEPYGARLRPFRWLPSRVPCCSVNRDTELRPGMPKFARILDMQDCSTIAWAQLQLVP